jgi:uncharacterized LabA/DUF88 family protein
MGVSYASNPDRSLRWMRFVDGENFTLMAQKLATDRGIELQAGPYWKKDRFAWIPSQAGCLPDYPSMPGCALAGRATRAYYYTSDWESPEQIEMTRIALWGLGFDPVVFRKEKGLNSKGVDIALSTDLLCHAFRDNYDVAVLVAGDGDYCPLVEEVKRLGKIVHVEFFGESYGLNLKLKLVADRFIDLTDQMIYNLKNNQGRPLPNR